MAMCHFVISQVFKIDFVISQNGILRFHKFSKLTILDFCDFTKWHCAIGTLPFCEITKMQNLL